MFGGFLSACSNTSSLDYAYPSSITIEKNVNARKDHEDYEVITLTDEDEIKSFIDALNTWRYSLEKGAILSVDTYEYVITFDDEMIKIVHFKYFYLDDSRTPYLLEEGSLDFIANLNWT